MDRWPVSADELVRLQRVLAVDAESALAAAPWSWTDGARVGGCFVAFASGEAGPGHPGDRAWAAAVVWQPSSSPVRADGTPHRRGDASLRGAHPVGAPRQAADVEAQSVVADRVPAGYAPGLLALREGAILDAAVHALASPPDVLLVDATGLDHPRRAGLAVQLGAVADVPTVGVTRRPLLAVGDLPPARRGAATPVRLGGRTVGCWVCTRTGSRPVVAHAAWRTDADIAIAVVLHASTQAARTPVPLQEARRVAREARALAGGD